jgi:hypothetical protein
MSHTLKNAMHPNQQNHYHIRKYFPPLAVTGLAESAIKDMSSTTHEFFIDEMPTQPTDEKQPHCPLRLCCPLQLVHNDYKIENTVALVSIMYDCKRSRKHNHKTPIFY